MIMAFRKSCTLLHRRTVCLLPRIQTWSCSKIVAIDLPIQRFSLCCSFQALDIGPLDILHLICNVKKAPLGLHLGSTRAPLGLHSGTTRALLWYHSGSLLAPLEFHLGFSSGSIRAQLEFHSGSIWILFRFHFQIPYRFHFAPCR